MSLNTDRLYGLLPAIYRIRDAQNGSPLRGLFDVLAAEAVVLEESLDQLYDDQFVETCADWVVPYLGDLIGVRALHGVVPTVSSPRAEVANTIGLRRRKGTAAVLEELVRSVTGWPAHAVEMFQWLGWTQYLNHTRAQPQRGGWFAVRDAALCDRIPADRGAFDGSARTIDTRRISNGRGRSNLPNVAIFVWRLTAYPVTRASARSVGTNRFTFNPLGLDAPLFHLPRTETQLSQLSDPAHVPATLRRRPLHDELEARRQSLVDDLPVSAVYFSDRPVFRLTLEGETEPIPPEELVVCDLTGWRVPPSTKTYVRSDQTTVTRTIRAAVDPVLGRLTLASGETAAGVTVSYARGLSADLGGGPYSRQATVTGLLDRAVTWQMGVSQEAPAVPGQVVGTLLEAVAAWNEQPAGTVGLIALMDSRSYADTITGANAIQIPAGSRLIVTAADWPEEPASEAGPAERRVGHVVPEGVQAHLQGELAVSGQAADSPGGELILDGVLLEGPLTVLEGSLGVLRLNHCTLAPATSRLTVNAGAQSDTQNGLLAVSLNRCMTGPISLPASVTQLDLVETVVSSGAAAADSDPAVTAPGAAATVDRCTILGQTLVEQIEASNSLFLGRLQATRRQAGCVRFSYLPWDSTAPRRYRCLPASGDPADAVRPQFTSRRHGDPGFAQLGPRTPLGLKQGADDESEMGVFHDLFQPQRATNAQVRIDEYLRFGLEAGLIYVN